MEQVFEAFTALGSISAASSGPAFLPEKRLSSGVSVGSFSEQRLVIEPSHSVQPSSLTASEHNHDKIYTSKTYEGIAKSK